MRDRPWWRAPYMVYFLFFHIPLAIAALCVTLVFDQGLAPWAGAALGVGVVMLLIPAGRIGARLGEQSRRESEAIAMVPRPRKCDRCHEIEPGTCPRPWLGTCPLRSIETGQTYRDFLKKS